MHGRLSVVSTLSLQPQEQIAAKAEAHKLQTALMEKDAALQRKDVEVGAAVAE